MVNGQAVLPVEIWEQILRYLPSRCLLQAADVCECWRYIVQRIAKEFCLQELHPRVIKELAIASSHRDVEVAAEKDGIFLHDIDPLGIFKLYGETLLNPVAEYNSLRTIDKINGFNCCDTFLVTWSSYSWSQGILNILDGSSFKVKPSDDLLSHVSHLVTSGWVSYSFDERISNVVYLALNCPIFLVRTFNGNLEAMTFSSDKSKDALESISICPPLPAHDQKMKAQDDLLLTRSPKESLNVLLLYLGTLRSSRELSFILLKKVYVESTPHHWNLWMNKITTIESSGHIKCYLLPDFYKKNVEVSCHSASNKQNAFGQITYPEGVTEHLISSSQLVKDFRYPNPALLASDLFFVSTLTSKGLLAFWHMDAGRDFWFVGSNTQPEDTSQLSTAVEEIYLKKVVIGKEAHVDEADDYAIAGIDPSEITALDYQRGMIFCGTAIGHILIYKCQDISMNVDSLASTLSGVPWMRLKVFSSRKYIGRVTCLFTPVGAILAVGSGSDCVLIHIPH